MGFGSRAFSGLRLAGVVAGAVVFTSAATGYWVFVSQQRQYIVGRDFRVLSNLATQIETTVQAETKVIRNLKDDPAESTDSLKARWLRLRGRPYQAADIEFIPRPPGDVSMLAEYGYETDTRLVLEVPAPPLRPDGGRVARLTLRSGLEPMLASRVGQGAFDAIFLGTTNGKVLLSAGETAQQIRSSGLGVLTLKAPAGGKPASFSEMAQTITMADVSLAGVDYTLFIYPCCLSAAQQGSPLILAGLVRVETLRAGSWAISTTLVKLSVLALLVAVIAWPFLKLILLGDRQQLRVSDFFQLGASSVAGVAIITIILLDISAYLRLQRDIDGQLRDLAKALDNHATEEIRDAYTQLQCLEQQIGSLPAASFKDGRVSSALKEPGLICRPGSADRSLGSYVSDADDRLDPGTQLQWAYPFFETVAFIDRDGMQRVKLGTAESVSNRISVAERDYFKAVARGRGWNRSSFCKNDNCVLESVWSWTTGEPLAVLAKASPLRWRQDGADRPLPVAAISIPMRSLIGPILPPGFGFAVIDRDGKVLFHSDRQRNGNENLFIETDNNRRLRAQIAAHSAEPLSISYWGSDYRAYLMPMALPDMYVVTMAQKERAWAINREWLVVTLIFVAIYLALWLIAALATLGPDASWVWPDPARRSRYPGISTLCAALLSLALITAWYYDRKLLLAAGLVVPLAGWMGAYLMLRHRPRTISGGRREPLFAYSLAAVLLLLVTGVAPGALLFLASYQLHARSYIKNSQLIVARRLNDRLDRLREEYLTADNGVPKPNKPAATMVGVMHDRDVYLDFLYGTSIRRAPIVTGDPPEEGRDPRTAAAGPDHDDTVLSLLEDYLPYYSEASVEWRELLHDRSDDGSWESRAARSDGGDEEIVFTSRAGSLAVELTSWAPSITHVPHAQLRSGASPRANADTPAGQRLNAMSAAGGAAADEPPDMHDSRGALVSWGLVLVALSCGVIQILNRRVYLVGITEPLWARGKLAENAGENVLVLCDKATKSNQLVGLTPLKLGPIVRERDHAAAWRRALFGLDERTKDGAVLIDDFDEDLDDAHGMDRKLALLDDLVSDPSRTVIVVVQVPLRALTDSLRHSARVVTARRQQSRSGETAAAANETTLEQWRRVLKTFVVVERRDQGALPGSTSGEPTPQSESAPSVPTRSWSDWLDDWRKRPVVAFLMSEGRSHPYVHRICEELLSSEAVSKGQLTRRQAYDEVAERTAQFYRGLWASCSEDEKVVLGHIARHGLANASVRSVVRRLLGRRLLCKDPALRPMNQTFCHFVLNRECSQQVSALETENGPSAWDRLRVPLGLAVVGVAVFLFATQKELYNAILGITTAAAVSVPTLIRTVGMLVGRPEDGAGAKA